MLIRTKGGSPSRGALRPRGGGRKGNQQLAGPFGREIMFYGGKRRTLRGKKEAKQKQKGKKKRLET